MKTEKKYLIYGIGLVLVTLIGVSLAYFATRIVGEQKELTVNTGDLRIVFTNGDDITGTDIEPGWSVSKTFSVENKTNSEYKYNIVLEDLVNTFTTSGFLVYKITSTSGYNMTEYEDIPKSSTETDTVLAYSVSIESKTTHNYTIEMKYLSSETVDQSEDMGKVLTGSLYISKGTIKTYTLAEARLRDNQTISERTDFSVTNVSNSTGTLYKTNKTEDGSEVYYYSGNTTNNWVKFGKFQNVHIVYRGYYSATSNSYNEYNTLNACNSASNYNYNCTEYKYANADDDMYWRIIRTNEDGSVRLLYAGTSHDTKDCFIGYSSFNNSYDIASVGYMYGGTSSLEDSRGNTTDSIIKGVIDTWYQNNLLTSYDKHTSKSAIYCNDRSNYQETFRFGAYTRLYTNKTPNYKCGANTSDGLFDTTQAVSDKFSASTIGGGNGDLTYPAALMTADEVVFAGGLAGQTLSSPYAWYAVNSDGETYFDNANFYSLSPAFVSTMQGSRMVMYTYGISLMSPLVGLVDILTVRPAISISPCAQVTGFGTAADPYVIDENNSLCS